MANPIALSDHQRFLQELPRWINVLLIENFGDENQEIENIVKVCDEYNSEEWKTAATSEQMAQKKEKKSQNNVFKWKIIAFTHINEYHQNYDTFCFTPFLSRDIIQNMGFPRYLPDLTHSNLSPIYTDTVFPVVIQVEEESFGRYSVIPFKVDFMKDIVKIAQDPDVSVPPIEVFWDYFEGIQLVLELREKYKSRWFRFTTSGGQTFNEGSLRACISIYNWCRKNDGTDGLYYSGFVNQIINYYDRRFSLVALFAGGPLPDVWGNYQRLTYGVKPEHPFRTDFYRGVENRQSIARFQFRHGCFVSKDALMAVSEQIENFPYFCSLLKEYTFAIVDGNFGIFTKYNLTEEEGLKKLMTTLYWTAVDIPIPYCPKVLIIAEGVNLLTITASDQTLPGVFRRNGALRRSDPEMGVELTINWFEFERAFNIGSQIPIFPFRQVMDCKDIPDYRPFHFRRGVFKDINLILGYYQMVHRYCPIGKAKTLLFEYINIWLGLGDCDPPQNYVYVGTYKVIHSFQPPHSPGMFFTYLSTHMELVWHGFEVFGEQIEGLPENSNEVSGTQRFLEQQRYQWFVNQLNSENKEVQQDVRYAFKQSFRNLYTDPQIKNGSEYSLSLFAEIRNAGILQVKWDPR